MTDFSSTNGALRVVKGTEEGNESHADLIRHCGKSPVTTRTVLHCVEPMSKPPTPLDPSGISGDLTDFSSTNGALRAVKETEEDV